MTVNIDQQLPNASDTPKKSPSMQSGTQAGTQAGVHSDPRSDKRSGKHADNNLSQRTGKPDDTLEKQSDNELAVPNSCVNVSGYRFVDLQLLPLLQADLYQALQKIGVKGTILLANEGINIALAGSAGQIDAARAEFDNDPRFNDIWLKQSYSDTNPFTKLKVRVRYEIIAFDGVNGNARRKARPEAPAMSPETLHSWLSEQKDFTLLDTRNFYEIESGGFDAAQHLSLDHFRDFQTAVDQALESGELTTDKPVVTFCTGGIRCEKAAPWMLERGFSEVYQIEGGVLNYFERCGGEFWTGDCFVFDDRAELDKQLRPTGARFCDFCKLTISEGQECNCQGSISAIETV